MDLETFTANFALIADTPNGIPKLREMILQLAVRGKLVPQDPNDEPASVLLQKIVAEKESLVAEGRIKKAKPLPPIKPDDELPYELPGGWEWARLGDLLDFAYGKGIPKSERVESGSIPIYGANGILGYHDRALIMGPSIIIGRKGSAGALNTVYEPCWPSDVTYYIHPPVGLDFDFTFLMLQSLKLESLAKGIKPGLNRNEAYLLIVSVPPFAEQKHIVSKVNELMARCDELEERQKKRDTVRMSMNSACLHELTSKESDKSQKGWTRARDNFDLLYDTPDNVAALRQSILQLAVMGKLVPQEPNDERASVLLERIAAEKERLIAEGKIKKSKPLPPIAPDEVPYQLSQGWEWVRLDLISQAIEYGTSHKASTAKKGVAVLRMNNIQNGEIILDNLKFVPAGIDGLPRLLLKTDDILFNRTNSYELVGKTGIFKGESHKYTFASYLIRVRLHTPWVIPDYVNMCLNARYFRVTQIEQAVTQQCGQANYSGGKLKTSLLPLPPLGEQKRIVEKVDGLMTLFEELESNLQQSRIYGEKLMAAVVNQVTMV